MVEDSRSIAELSLKAVNDASKALSRAAHESAAQGRPGTEKRIA